MKGITLVNYNFKGGVGKTTLTGMESFILNRDKNVNKILLIDFDPQGNLTMMMKNTYHVEGHADTSFYKGLLNNDLSNSRLKLTDKMDLIEADMDLNDWIEKIANQDRKTRWHILEKSLAGIKHDYDYIMIDVPPTLNDIVRNAIFASDGVSIVLQTQKMSYNSALISVSKIIEMRKKYNAKFAFLGVVLYLRKKAKIDRDIIAEAKDTFEGNLYANTINYHERVNIFTAEGVHVNDYWDRRAIGMYQQLTDELQDRVREMIING